MIDLAHIQRIDAQDDRAEPGWRVTLPRDQSEESRDFFDAERGGPLAAFLRAVHWRDQAEGRSPSSVSWVNEGLERVDRGGVHGWWVSAVMGQVLDADLFEDEAHDGMRGALAAALAWRRRVAPAQPRRGRSGGDSTPRRRGRGSNSRGKRGPGPRGKRGGDGQAAPPPRP